MMFSTKCFSGRTFLFVVGLSVITESIGTATEGMDPEGTTITTPEVITPTDPTETAEHLVGIVNLVEANGSGTTGTLHLYQSNNSDQVTIQGQISNLASGEHGFHVHTNGATDNECGDAGGHFNPLDMIHGSPDSEARHVGDLGNIVSTSSVEVTNISITDSEISLKEGSVSNIMNRSIVIHQGADNFTGASGNAGARISCGVIEKRSYTIPTVNGYCGYLNGHGMHEACKCLATNQTYETLCKPYCNNDSGCKAYDYGLPENSDVPNCRYFTTLPCSNGCTKVSSGKTGTIINKPTRTWSGCYIKLEQATTTTNAIKTTEATSPTEEHATTTPNAIEAKEATAPTEGSPSSAAQPSTGPPSAAFFVALLLTWQKWWSEKL